ncbi:Ribonuclease H-like superfamily [Sesbania bispinosa]|nr:Ribonuclease H-like superfamily [Sesbania bispinosa]
MPMNKESGTGSDSPLWIPGNVVMRPLVEYDKYVVKRKRLELQVLKQSWIHYLDEEVLPRSNDFDILLWWKLNGVNPHRSRLHWTTLEALMCAKSWLWSVENGGYSKTIQEYATLLNEIGSDDEGELMASTAANSFQDS